MSVRPTRLAAALAALALLAGCGESEGITGGGTVIGETLTVYSLLPQPGVGASRDIVDGERLALRQAGGRAGGLKVNFASLDETRGEPALPADELPGAVASITRQAISDPQVIAVIGDTSEDTARVTVPLLNSAGILHLSPGVVYPGFTTEVEPGEPERWYPAGPRTFFPLAPDVAAQARALADTLEGRVLVEQEESPTGRAFGAALRRALGEGRLARDAAGAAAAVYAGTDPADAAGVVGGLRRENREIDVYLPSPLAGTAVARRPRVVALSAFPAADRELAAAFEEAFGRAPTPAAVAGHTAMRAVLAALDDAGGRAASRQAVIDAFRGAERPAGRLLTIRYRGGEPVVRPLR